MLTKRIIPCLDVKDGRTVKGVNFVGLRDAGDPVELATRYAQEGADEVVFLDISATLEKRKTLADLVSRVAAVLDIPFTVGGGVRDVEDVRVLLDAGADKVSVNSAAVRRPQLVDELAREFGSQCIVVAVDSKTSAEGDRVFVGGGTIPTDAETLTWVREAEARGAGEFLLTSMDHDGTKNGFAVSLTRRVSDAVRVPVIASGGAGSAAHFVEIFEKGSADAALAASIFHYREFSVTDVKRELQQHNIPVRL